MKNYYFFIILLIFSQSGNAMQNNNKTESEEKKDYIKHVVEQLKPMLKEHDFFRKDNSNQQAVEVGLHILRKAVQGSYALRNKQEAFDYKRTYIVNKRASYDSYFLKNSAKKAITFS